MPRPSTVHISRTKWAILFSEQGGCCAGCFKPLGEDVHVDHVNPLARDGQDVFGNLQLLHGSCNLEKGDMPAEAWFKRQWRRLLMEVAAIRRRQVLVTIDPEIVARLRLAARKSRVPVSVLVEEGAKRVLGLSGTGERQGSNPFVPPPGPAGHADLFSWRL